MLSAQLPLCSLTDTSSTTARGKGVWRAHPRLASDAVFREKIDSGITHLISTLDPQMFAQLKWEELKAVVCRIT
jgi:hypothetical protein